MISAGGLGECELRLAQTELPETQRTDQRRAPPTMRWIVVVADPPCVVQDREKQDHDLVTPGVDCARSRPIEATSRQ